MLKLKKGDRVRNIYARDNLGTVVSVCDDCERPDCWVQVRWDLRAYEPNEAEGSLLGDMLELIEPNPPAQP